MVSCKSRGLVSLFIFFFFFIMHFFHSFCRLTSWSKNCQKRNPNSLPYKQSLRRWTIRTRTASSTLRCWKSLSLPKNSEQPSSRQRWGSYARHSFSNPAVAVQELACTSITNACWLLMPTWHFSFFARCLLLEMVSWQFPIYLLN